MWCLIDNIESNEGVVQREINRLPYLFPRNKFPVSSMYGITLDE